jgi:hypothetical protein
LLRNSGQIIYDDSEIPIDVRNFFVERELAKLLCAAFQATAAADPDAIAQATDSSSLLSVGISSI